MQWANENLLFPYTILIVSIPTFCHNKHVTRPSNRTRPGAVSTSEMHAALKLFSKDTWTLDPITCTTSRLAVFYKSILDLIPKIPTLWFRDLVMLGCSTSQLD